MPRGGLGMRCNVRVTYNQVWLPLRITKAYRNVCGPVLPTVPYLLVTPKEHPLNNTAGQPRPCATHRVLGQQLAASQLESLQGCQAGQQHGLHGAVVHSQLLQVGPARSWQIPLLQHQSMGNLLKQCVEFCTHDDDDRLQTETNTAQTPTHEEPLL